MANQRSRIPTLQTQSAGKLDPDVLRPHESIEAVWTHIIAGLEALAANGKADQTSLNEGGLTQRLFDELEGQDGYRPYYFHNERMENDDHGHSPRVDLAVLARQGNPIVVNGVSHGAGSPFLVLEAKRLPASEKKCEREYVAGNRGGIERFKRGKHADALKEVGMIGYVQSKSFNHWHRQINQWVDEVIASSPQDLSWDVRDRLEMEANSSRLARLRSHSLRKTDNHRLVIRHLWVRLAQVVDDLSS